jgi:hypothetical protein
MQVIIRKRAINAITKAAIYIERINTPGSGDRWAGKIRHEITALANSKAKLAICKHPSLAKFKYRCFTYKDWIIAFRISNKEFEICRFIYGARLS